MKDIAKRLKSLNKTWKKTKAKKNQIALKDGKYIVEIIDNRIEKSKASDRLQVVALFQVKSPHENKNKIIYKYTGLETESNFSFLKKDLKTLGVKIPKDLVNLTKSLSKTIGLVCEVTIKTTPPFTNIWINCLIEEDDLEAEE